MARLRRSSALLTVAGAVVLLTLLASPAAAGVRDVPSAGPLPVGYELGHIRDAVVWPRGTGHADRASRRPDTNSLLARRLPGRGPGLGLLPSRSGRRPGAGRLSRLPATRPRARRAAGLRRHPARDRATVRWRSADARLLRHKRVAHVRARREGGRDPRRVPVDPRIRPSSRALALQQPLGRARLGRQALGQRHADMHPRGSRRALPRQPGLPLFRRPRRGVCRQLRARPLPRGAVAVQRADASRQCRFRGDPPRRAAPLVREPLENVPRAARPGMAACGSSRYGSPSTAT